MKEVYSIESWAVHAQEMLESILREGGLNNHRFQDAAKWASIYTACRLIVAERTEAEELRKMEDAAHDQ